MIQQINPIQKHKSEIEKRINELELKFKEVFSVLSRDNSKKNLRKELDSTMWIIEYMDNMSLV